MTGPRRERAAARRTGPDGDHRRAARRRSPPSSSSAATGSGRRLGAGGFGTVYAATDERLQRAVAVKVIPSAPRATRRARPPRGAGRRAASTIPGWSPSSTPARTRGRATWSPSSSTAARSTSSSAEGVLSRPRRAADRARAVRRARARPRPRRRAPRRQAAERDRPRRPALGGRRGQAGRLRRRPPRRRRAADAHRRRRRHAGLHGARAGRRPAGRRARRPLQPRARALRGARRASTRSAPARPPRPRAGVGTVLPPLRRSRKDLPEELCAAIDRALRPRPDERGTLDELAAELAESLPEVSDEGGTVAPHPLERTEPFGPLPRGVDRARPPPLLAGGLVAAALAWAGPAAAAPRSPPSPRSRCSRALGWLAAAVATIAMLAAERARRRRAGRRGASRPCRCCCAGAARPGRVPALAPAARARDGLAGAYPALAGRAPRPARPAPRSARSAPGGRCWPRRCWARALLVRAESAAVPPLDRRRRPLDDVLRRRSLTCGALLYAALWALAALRAALARARPLARRWTSSRRRSGPPRWAPHAPRSPSPSALQSRAGWSLGARRRRA